MSDVLMSKSALTRLQAAVIAAVIVVAAVGGGYYYWIARQKPVEATVYVPRTETVTNMTVGVVFSVSVGVSKAIVDVHNWTFSLSFDPTLLLAVEVLEGDFLKRNGTTTFNAGTIEGGTINDVNCVLTDSGVAARGNGTLATITFKTTKDVGISSLDLKNVALLDPGGGSILCDVVSSVFATIPWEGMPPSDYAGTLNVFEWGGYEDPNLWNAGKYAFNRIYPKVEVKFSFFVDEAEALTKLQAGFRPDVVHPCGASVPRWVDAGVIEPINISLIPLWKNMTEKFQTFDQNFVNDIPYFVPQDWGYSTVMYRPDLLEAMGIPKINPDTGENQWDTFNLLFDPKGGKMYKKIAFMDSATETFPMAALAAGIKPDELWNMTEAQLAICRQKFVEQKQGGMIRFYWKVPADTISAMQKGEIVAANIWGEEYAALKSAGVNVTFSWPKEGLLAWVCGSCVVEGVKARNPDLYKIAHAFLNAWIDPQAGANLIDLYAYGTPNKDAAKIAKKQEDIVKPLYFDDPTILDRVILWLYSPNEPRWYEIYLEVKADP